MTMSPALNSEFLSIQMSTSDTLEALPSKSLTIHLLAQDIYWKSIIIIFFYYVCEWSLLVKLLLGVVYIGKFLFLFCGTLDIPVIHTLLVTLGPDLSTHIYYTRLNISILYATCQQEAHLTQLEPI